MNIGRAMRELRIERNFSQRDVQALTGLNRTWISKCEDNRCQPMIRSLMTVAGALGITVTDIVARAESLPGSGEIEPCKPMPERLRVVTVRKPRKEHYKPSVRYHSTVSDPALVAYRQELGAKIRGVMA